MSRYLFRVSMKVDEVLPCGRHRSYNSVSYFETRSEAEVSLMFCLKESLTNPERHIRSISYCRVLRPKDYEPLPF